MPVKIQKDLKGKFQKMQTAKTKPVKAPVVQEGKHVQNEKAVDLDQYRTERSHGAEDKNVQNREVLYQNERMKMIFHGPSVPHGPKS